MLATRQPTHQTAKPLTLYKRFPLKNKGFQALFMLKPLFIKRKQLNFQKHIGCAKTNPARQSPRAGLFARRSAPSRRFCARAGARCAVDLMEGLCGPRLGQWCQRHSAGTYLAGMVPKPVDRPRVVAVALVVEAQAQSMAPVTPATNCAFWTFGVKTSVLL